MPSGTLDFRPVVGGFAFVYASFMCRRAREKAAMFQRVLKPRNKPAGVMVGVLLFLLYFGSLLHQCGDIELNPGPPGRRTTSGDRTDEPTLKDVMSMLSNMNVKFDSVKDDVKEMKDLYANLQDEIRELREEVQDLRHENSELTRENEDLKARVENVERKADDLESRSKRNNLVFYGLPRGENESWEDCEAAVKELITDTLELGDDFQFDRVHRVNAKPDSPVVARCTFYKDKEKILKAKRKLKGSKVFIGEDFSQRVRETRKKLVPHLKTAQKDGKKAVMVYDHLLINGKKFVPDTDGQLHERK